MKKVDELSSHAQPLVHAVWCRTEQRRHKQQTTETMQTTNPIADILQALPVPTEPSKGTWVQFTLKADNRKTGKMPVSTTTRESCPPSCPFYLKGCYALQQPLRGHWDLVSRGERGDTWDVFCAQVKALPEGKMWRHNQAGDLPGRGETVDHAELALLVEANKGKRGFTYTHKTNLLENIPAIRHANTNGFTVNLSANSLAHADKLASLNAGPVVVVLPETQTTNTVTPEGRRVVVCPYGKVEGLQCVTCGLCQRQRSVIIGFPAHGGGKNHVSKLVAN